MQILTVHGVLVEVMPIFKLGMLIPGKSHSWVLIGQSRKSMGILFRLNTYLLWCARKVAASLGRATAAAVGYTDTLLCHQSKVPTEVGITLTANPHSRVRKWPANRRDGWSHKAQACTMLDSICIARLPADCRQSADFALCTRTLPILRSVIYTPFVMSTACDNQELH